MRQSYQIMDCILDSGIFKSVFPAGPLMVLTFHYFVVPEIFKSLF
jgi:hypothetical protein